MTTHKEMDELFNTIDFYHVDFPSWLKALLRVMQYHGFRMLTNWSSEEQTVFVDDGCEVMTPVKETGHFTLFLVLGRTFPEQPTLRIGAITSMSDLQPELFEDAEDCTLVDLLAVNAEIITEEYRPADAPLNLSLLLHRFRKKVTDQIIDKAKQRTPKKRKT